MLQDIDSITGLDPNPAMEPYAEQAAAAAGLLPRQLHLRQGVAEQIPLPDASTDLVICTLVRCITQLFVQQQQPGRMTSGLPVDVTRQMLFLVTHVC